MMNTIIQPQLSGGPARLQADVGLYLWHGDGGNLAETVSLWARAYRTEARRSGDET